MHRRARIATRNLGSTNPGTGLLGGSWAPFLLALAALVTGLWLSVDSGLGVPAAASFGVSTALVSLGLLLTLRDKSPTIELVSWIFMYFFMVLAPLLQWRWSATFPNLQPIHESDLLRANAVITVWNAVFICTGTWARRKPHIVSGGRPSTWKFPERRIGAPAVALACFLVVMLGSAFGGSFFLGSSRFAGVLDFQPAALFVGITVPGIAVLGLVASIERVLNRRPPRRVALFQLAVASLTCMLLVNPFNTPRYYLAGIAILLAYRYVASLRRPWVFATVLSMGLATVFPFLAQFRRVGWTTPSVLSLPELALTQVGELHFDAYGNLVALLRYSDRLGHTDGGQLLGTLLFFVPRQIWESKPMFTGSLAAYESGLFGATGFNNVSAPLPGELWLDFGWMGILVGAMLAGFGAERLRRVSSHWAGPLAYGLVLGFTVFVLRGSLMPAWAYLVGTATLLIGIPWAVQYADHARSRRSRHSLVPEPTLRQRGRSDWA